LPAEVFCPSHLSKNLAKIILAVLHCSKFLLLPFLAKLLIGPKRHKKIAGAENIPYLPYQI
jgi:hypothetical protein